MNAEYIKSLFDKNKMANWPDTEATEDEHYKNLLCCKLIDSIKYNENLVDDFLDRSATILQIDIRKNKMFMLFFKRFIENYYDGVISADHFKREVIKNNMV